MHLRRDRRYVAVGTYLYGAVSRIVLRWRKQNDIGVVVVGWFGSGAGLVQVAI